MKWLEVPLPKVALINPSRPRNLEIVDDQLVTFVPMPAVSEQTASIEHPEKRPYADVKKGFTYFEENDVLFAKITPCMENGKSAIASDLIGEVGFGSTEFHVIRSKKSLLLPKYVHYFIRQQSFRDNAKARMRGAAGQQRVPKNFLDDIILPLPPISEQNRIVEILDQADRLRKLLADSDAKSQRILPTLFIKMFGDPVANPMEWPTFRISSPEILDIKGGGTPSKKNPLFWNGIIPWVSPKDMKEDIIEDTIDHITDEAINQSSTNKVPKNSILLVVRSGILAHTVPIAITGKEVALNQDMKAFVVRKDTKLNSLYLFGWMKAAASTLMRGCIKFGATVHSIDMNKLMNMNVILPPIDFQKEFSKMFLSLLDYRLKQQTRAGKIDRLFSTLLHRAFTGDLTASWREKYMKELLREMELQAKALAS